MDMKQFYNRFDTTIVAPENFLKKLKKIQHGLDCRFNKLEKRWMIIKWKASPMLGQWDWVMTVQDQDTKTYIPLCDWVLLRLQYLKKVFEEDQVLKIIQMKESKYEENLDKDIENVSGELAKTTRKVLLNNFDGTVSTWNNFV